MPVPVSIRPMIYVVFGSTGEYSDRSNWVVVAFLDEAKAQERVKLASDVAREIQNHASADSKWWYGMKWEERQALNPYDSSFNMDYYSGTSYYVDEAPIEDWPAEP